MQFRFGFSGYRRQRRAKNGAFRILYFCFGTPNRVPDPKSFELSASALPQAQRKNTPELLAPPPAAAASATATIEVLLTGARGSVCFPAATPDGPDTGSPAPAPPEALPQWRRRASVSSGRLPRTSGSRARCSSRPTRAGSSARLSTATHGATGRRCTSWPARERQSSLGWRSTPAIR